MGSSNSLRQPGLIVYASGVATSILVLWLVRVLGDNEVNVMGWYANRILPIGAWLVGIASGLGYAVASRYLQVKLGRAFVMGMISTALVDYIAAQYLTYQHLIEISHVSEERYTFIRYLQDICEQMSFTRAGLHEEGSPLGKFGYVYKALEAAGYVLGAMMPAWIVSRMPYCKRCQLYMKQHLRGYVHSLSRWPEVKALKRKDRAAALGLAVQELASQANTLASRLATTTLDESVAAVSQLVQTADKKSAASVVVDLKKCPGCESHHLSYMLTTWSVDKKPAQKPIAQMEKQAGEAGIKDEAPASI